MLVSKPKVAYLHACVYFLFQLFEGVPIQ